MSPHPRSPRAPQQPLVRDGQDIVGVTGPLWRVHRTEGPHVAGWDTLRAWGPAANCRWDPHPQPVGLHPGEGVSYTATDLATAVVEAFQDTRRIDPNSGRPRATSWMPTRVLRLLDLTDDWCLRNGASAALTAAPRSTCQAWARAIRAAWADLDGLRTSSVLTGRTNVTLFAPAADTFPMLPEFSEFLSDDVLWDRLDHLARRYRNAGYRLL